MEKRPKRKYAKPISFYPLKWWEAMRSFMQIDSNKAMKIKEKIKD
jgi:hypothetical protein